MFKVLKFLEVRHVSGSGTAAGKMKVHKIAGEVKVKAENQELYRMNRF